MNRSEQEWHDNELDRAVVDESADSESERPARLSQEERQFYNALPEHLGRARMARLVDLVDWLELDNARLHKESER